MGDRYEYWTEDEIRILKKDYPNKYIKLSDISKKINRSIPAISQRAKRIGLTKMCGGYKGKYIRTKEYKEKMSNLKMGHEVPQFLKEYWSKRLKEGD